MHAYISHTKTHVVHVMTNVIKTGILYQREDVPHLKDVPEVFVGEVCDAQAARGFAPEQPCAALALGVYKDGEARRARHHYAVLHTQLVRRQPLRQNCC